MFIMRCKHRNCPVGRDALHPAATLPCLCIINFVMYLTSICRDDEPLPIYFTASFEVQRRAYDVWAYEWNV